MAKPKYEKPLYGPKRADELPDQREWNANTVEEKCAELQSFWHDRKEDDKERRALYRGEDLTEAPADRSKLIVDPKIIKGRRAQEIIDFYTGILAIQASYSVEAYGVGKSPQAKAEKAGRWLNALFPAMEFLSGEDTTLLTTREALTLGYSAIKTLPYPQAWHDWPEPGEGQKYDDYNRSVEEFMSDGARIPIRSYHVPAMDWIPLLHGRKVLLHVEYKDVPVGWVRSRYPDAAKGWNAKDTDKVKLAEVIDHDWCGYYVFAGQGAEMTRTALRFWQHHMDLPDGQAPTALYECNKTSESDLKWRWASLIETLRDVLELEDFILSQEATIIRAFWQPTMILRLLQHWSPEALAEAQQLRRFQVGGTNFEFAGADGTSGEQYRLFELPGELPQILMSKDYIRERIQAFLPPTLTGASAAGDSGYKANRDTENAERRLNPIADNFARGDADKAKHAFHAVHAVGKIAGKEGAAVTVRESTGDGSRPISVAWDDVKAYGVLVKTVREYQLDTDFLRQADAMIKYLSEPISAPRRWVLETIGKIENPTEWDDEKLAEKIMSDPAFEQMDVENVLTEMGVAAMDEFGMSAGDLAGRLANGEVIPPAGEALAETFAPPPPVQSGRAGQATEQPERYQAQPTPGEAF